MPAPPVGSVPAMDSTLAGAVGAGQGMDAGVGDMAVCREKERDSAIIHVGAPCRPPVFADPDGMKTGQRQPPPMRFRAFPHPRSFS